MKTRDFYYRLPEHLIAQSPPENRTHSRLLHYSRDSAQMIHTQFTHLADFIQPGDCLVFNDTRVIPARLYGRKQTGGKVEILLERLVNHRCALAHIKASHSPGTGSRITVNGNNGTSGYQLEVSGRNEDLFILSSLQEDMTEIMRQAGHMPLPPYITREDTAVDFSRYQTVYARNPGAVAAPTAGLHFDESLLQKLKDKQVTFAYVTLHVGAGTFQPVRADKLEDHIMHVETLSVPQKTVMQCQQAREQGRRIIAVGTTSVRALETASQAGKLQAYEGETQIFIYPGYRFKSVDALITNFHLPESTLLMLISAFASTNEIKNCYQQAIEHEYRFFSYGDAMFIT